MFDGRAQGGQVAVTIIEIITMVAWLALVLAGQFVEGTIVLALGLYYEHVVANNVGAGHGFPAYLTPYTLNRRS